jgi:hypothetical protein
MIINRNAKYDRHTNQGPNIFRRPISNQGDVIQRTRTLAVSVRAMKASRGTGGVALLIPNFGARWR